jgi:hypothetical protein
MRCDMVQGFLFSRPVPANDIDALVGGRVDNARIGGGNLPNGLRAAGSA